MSLPLLEALRQCRSHALYLQSALDDIQLPLTQAALNATFSASRQLMEWLDTFERKTQSAWPST